MSIPGATQPLSTPGGAGSGGGGAGTPQEEIAKFVAAVRTQLDDLSADEVTELTGGLEADLTDALAEEGATPSQRYGDPAEYARELRAAAGLPPRATGVRRAAGGRSLGLMTASARGWVDETRRVLEASPWWDGLLDFLLVLRPAWWVLRAWVAVELAMMMLGAANGVVPGGFPGFLVLIAAVVGSVQLGRHSPLRRRGHQVLITLGNVVAVVALLLVVAATSSTDYESAGVSYTPPSGLSANGEQVSNVFPYDSQGRPLAGVQLYDQDGHPLEIGEDDRYYDDGSGSGGELVPGSEAGTPSRWNVYPMQVRKANPVNGELEGVEKLPPPFTAVPPLIAAPTSGATPAPDATSSSSASPTPGATPSSSAAATAGATTSSATRSTPSATK